MSEEGTTTGKSYLTPFNIVAGIIVIIGLYVTVLRFTQGLGTVTNPPAASATPTSRSKPIQIPQGL